MAEWDVEGTLRERERELKSVKMELELAKIDLESLREEYQRDADETAERMVGLEGFIVELKAALLASQSLVGWYLKGGK